MSTVFVFLDASGNLDFSEHQDASRYFVLTSVTTRDCSVGEDLLSLRRQLAWEGLELQREFHATDDSPVVRQRVFETIRRHDLRIDATVFNKSRAYERIKRDPDYFYKLAMFMHLKRVAPRIATSADSLMLIGASFAVKKRRRLMQRAFMSVAEQTAPTREYCTAYWPAATDPCLQVADYCCWAIQRKWESNRRQGYRMIEGKIETERSAF